jgi:hypothetical protein
LANVVATFVVIVRVALPRSFWAPRKTKSPLRASSPMVALPEKAVLL